MYNQFAFYYDALMRESFDYEKWASYLESFFKKETKTLLDMGGGTGVLSVELLKKNYHVTIVDRSEEMLTLCEERTATYQNKRILQGEFHTFLDTRQYDAVMMTCDVMNYVLTKKELKQGFRHTYHHLKEGGVFLFDLVTANKLQIMLGNKTHTYVGDDISYIWENRFCFPKVTSYITFFARHVDNTYQRFEETHVQRVWQAEEIIALLQDCGFKKVKVYKAFTKQKAKEKEDVRIQFIAMK